MKISSLEIENFRNYKSASVKFDGGLNVIFGDNATGKTNMLESVYMASMLHSPRTLKDKELIKIGEEKASIKVVVDKKYKKYRIDIQIDESGKKRVMIDKIPVQRAGELLGVLGVVFFSPDEMKLIKESPQERRRFMDIGLSQQQKSYFICLQRYNKLLKQKNNLLKNYNHSDHADEMLDVWDLSLAKEGAIIISKRVEYIQTLNQAANRFHKEISMQKEELKLSYETTIENFDNVEKELYQKIVASREKDKELGFSTVGPHRDDIKIEINGKDSRKYASQGQQRSIALSMKLGEVVIYKDEIGEPPVLLLDDVLSELDETRQTMLLKMTEGFQTIITTCNDFTVDCPAKIIKISNGKVVGEG